MIVHAKGPNMVKNISFHPGFRTNLMSSTMNMPRNFEEHSYTESTRSLYYRRETSPTTSVRSDFQPRNFHQPFRQGHTRSTYTGRGGSPVSVRSIDSLSSIDIIRAIQTGNFSDDEWRKMQLAFKRKANNHFHSKRRAEYDSGEQGCNSSISSDDSTRTGYSRYNRKHKENIPRNLTDFRSTDREFRNNNRDDFISRDNNMFTNYADSNTENPYRRETQFHHVKDMASLQANAQMNSNKLFAQTSIEKRLPSQKNTLCAPRNAFASHGVMNGQGNMSSVQRNNLNSSICSTKSLQNQTVLSQRDRFKNGFQFPSQRFNNSIMPFQEHEENGSIKNSTRRCGNNDHSKQSTCLDEDSDENEIFPDTTLRSQQVPKNNKLSGQKRNIDSLESIPIIASKRHKTLSNKDAATRQAESKKITENTDFVFAKPAFPVRKSGSVTTREKLISKSADSYQPEPVVVANSPSRDAEVEPELSDCTQLTTSNMSMRPSFMKRKLFTQTLDVTERKNNSCDNLNTDSPQSNIYSELSREKHRTRKLVTSQSLLSRDVNQDDNNLLDLIHKIVPQSQVNTSKQPKVSVDKAAADDKWDVTSIISTCNNDSVSDTYTDDEIFKVADDVKEKSKEQPNKAKQNKTIDIKKKPVKPDTKKVENAVNTKCIVVLEKLKIVPINAEVADDPCLAKKPVVGISRIDAFWDTDVESDSEYGTPIKRNEKCMQGTQRSISTPKQSTIVNHIDVKPMSSVMKQTKNTITGNSKPIIVTKNNRTSAKSVKKQSNKQLLTKPNTKIVKSVKDKNPQPNKSDKEKKATSSAKIIRTRSQVNSTLESVEKSHCAIKVLTSVTKKSRVESNKKDKMNKTTDRNVHKTQPLPDSPMTLRSKKQNNSLLTGKTRKIEDKVQTRRNSKPTNVQEGSSMLCKVLRSRHIDLSSSFNSDQFELTAISRVRKSRTRN